MTENKKDKDKGSVVAGLAICGCLATGLFGIIGGVVGFSDNQPSRGLCLIAAAFAFGVVVHVSFSD
jgi:hypothetical protein